VASGVVYISGSNFFEIILFFFATWSSGTFAILQTFQYLFFMFYSKKKSLKDRPIDYNMGPTVEKEEKKTTVLSPLCDFAQFLSSPPPPLPIPWPPLSVAVIDPAQDTPALRRRLLLPLALLIA